MIGVNIVAGLCNRLFQMAYAYSMAKKYNLQFRLENWQTTSHHSPDTYEWLIQRFIKLPNYCIEGVHYNREIKEEGADFTTYKERYDPCMHTDNVWLYGFFQNEKYFREYRTDILELFKEPEFVSEYITKHYGQLLSLLEKSYFLHIRLGDYVGHCKHWIHLENYYLQVLKMIGEHPLVIFTNDWSRLAIVYPRLVEYLKERFHICIREQNEVVCLYMMARCGKGGICGNSTFGWWGSWLNGRTDKEVYFPEQWLANKGFVCDIYPEGAKIIPV